ncbi:MAG: SDR family NAD(P)-dependent oxidoreductase [Gemmatimonadales bacterium]
MTLIDLSSKTVLITGGSRGIGAAAARLFAHAGADVAITYREREGEAGKVLESIAGSVRAVAFQADLSTREANERVVAQTVEAFGRLDCFVANAGIWPAEDVPVKDLSDERWRETLAINLDGVFFGCRAALGVMEPGSSIVIVSSTAGQRGEAFHADYAATKGALIAFVKSLAVEAAPAITVNAVAPGWVDTEMSAGPYQASGGRGRTEIERSIPLQRVASAEDVAGPIVFLCSRLARHVTGEILNVNGGAVLCG